MSLPSVEAPDGIPDPETLASLLPGYERLRCIGCGAMGAVFEAWHEPLERKVALKLLHPNLRLQPLTVERFFREARSMARLRHPHIVQVFEVGESRELPWFSMELVQGGSLKDRIQREGPLAPREAASIVRDIAHALTHAHREGILHRDIKPGNVLLDEEGRAWLTDFGLVRQAGTATLTATDAIIGTPQYMSPEQVRGEPLDPRSDLFSLGATFYEALAGRPAFHGENPVVTLRAICESPPESLRRLRPEIPSSLEAIVMKMLEKDPARRYGDARECLEDLERYLRGEAVEATLPSALTRAWRRLRSNRLATRFAVATLLLSVLVLGYLYEAGVSASATESEARIGQAIQAIQAGAPERALELLASLPQEERETGRVRLLVAQSAWKAGDPGLGLYHVLDLLHEEPGHPEALSLAFTLAEATGAFSLAQEILEQIPPESLELPPGLLRVRLLRRQAWSLLEDALWYEAALEGPKADLAVDLAVRQDLVLRAQAALLVSTARGLLRRERQEQGGSAPLEAEALLLEGLEILAASPGAARKERLRRNPGLHEQLSTAEPEAGDSLLDRLTLTYAITRLPEAAEVAREDRWQASAEELSRKYGAMLSTAELAMNLARSEAESAFQTLRQGSPEKPVRGPLGRATQAIGDALQGLFFGD